MKPIAIILAAFAAVPAAAAGRTPGQLATAARRVSEAFSPEAGRLASEVRAIHRKAAALRKDAQDYERSCPGHYVVCGHGIDVPIMSMFGVLSNGPLEDALAAGERADAEGVVSKLDSVQAALEQVVARLVAADREAAADSADWIDRAQRDLSEFEAAFGREHFGDHFEGIKKETIQRFAQVERWRGRRGDLAGQARAIIAAIDRLLGPSCGPRCRDA